MRVSAETSDRETAETNARTLAREIAMRQLLGVTSDTVTLGQLFAAYHEHKGRRLNRQWKRGAETRATMFKGVWG